MYVLCMLCMIRTGRSRWYGPEGREDMDRKVRRLRTGRSIRVGPEGLPGFGTEVPWDTWTGRSHRVMAWKGVCVVCGILGNSLSIYAYSVVLCVSGTSEDRGKAPTWSVHTRGVLHVMILGCNVKGCYVIHWHFYNYYEWKYVFKMWKIVSKIYIITIWYQSLGLRDSGATSDIFELKLRIWEVFSQINQFCWKE